MILAEFNQKYGMQKKIVIHNSPELYKREVTDGVRAGVPSVNCEGQTLAELACSLLRDDKIARGEFMETADRPALIGIMMSCALEAVHSNELKYFRESMIDGGTARQLLSDVELLRKEEKLEALKCHEDPKLADVYVIAGKYVRRLEEKNLYDTVRIISEATMLAEKGVVAPNADVIAVYEEALQKFTVVEERLWQKLTVNRKVEVIERSREQVGNHTESSGQTKVRFFRVFGLHNEIHAVVKDVLRSEIPWEQVQIIACTNESFYPMATYLQELGVPYCMPEGISEEYGYPAAWIRRVLDNPANFTIDSHGRVRMSEVLEVLAQKLESGLESRSAAGSKLPAPVVLSILGKASVCRKSAADCGFDTDYGLAVKMAEIMLLGGRITEESSEEGAVYIGSLAGTETVFRRYVYLIGFESRNYPGADTQSPVLLDEDMELLGLDERHKASMRREEAEEKLERIMSSGAERITVSYVSYDTVNMREQNPSSFYQKQLERTGGEEELFGFGEENADQVLEAREKILL